MGFWESARDEAGKEYGRLHAARIARLEKLKRASGAIGLGLLVLFITGRTYWQDITGAVPYGVGAVMIFIGVCTSVALYVRTRRTRTRRRPYMYTRPVRTERRTYGDFE